MTRLDLGPTLRTALLLTLTVSLSDGASAAQLATATTDPDGLRLEPLVEATTWRLTVSGPDGYVARREFGAGAPPFFSLRDEDKVPEGRFTWELRIVDPKANGAASSHGDPLQFGHFTVGEGVVVTTDATVRETPRPVVESSPPLPDHGPVTVHPNDVAIQGNLCAGVDCTNAEPFAFQGMRLKGNNLQIDFEDTSAGMFATNDWQIRVNDSTVGGADYWAVEDVDGGADPFTIEAGAGDGSLWIDEVGRVGVGTATPSEQLHVAGKAFIDGDLEVTSSRDAKESFQPVDARDVLSQVATLPIVRWSYRGDPDKTRHLGPFAEDFSRTFALGSDARRLSPLDVAGVALVAIQGLEEQVASQTDEIAALREERTELAARLAALEALLQPASP